MFAILFGVFAGGYTASWTGCAMEVKKRTPDSEIATMLGFMAAGRGFGCVLMGPVSEALLGLGSLHTGGAYGTRYGSLIVFTGLSVSMGRFGLFGRWGLQAEESGSQPRKDSGEGERECLIG